MGGDDPFPGVKALGATARKAPLRLRVSNTSVNEVQFPYSDNRSNVIPATAESYRQINEALPGFFPMR